MGGRVVRLLSLLGALMFTLGPSTVRASGIEVQPIALKLSAKVSSAMLAITNRTTEPVRFHVTAMAWQQKPDGEMVFEPTQDIMFFPAMLTLNPQEARNLRVGVKVKPSSVEKTYRVFVQELPRLVTSSAPNGSAIGMIAKMAIPVFVAPEAPKASPSVTGLSVQGSQVKFAVKNTGNVHYRPDAIELKAKAGDTVLHTEDLHAWYVLAGGTLEYSFTLPAAACAATQTIDIELKADEGRTRSTLANVRCTP